MKSCLPNLRHGIDVSGHEQTCFFLVGCCKRIRITISLEGSCGSGGGSLMEIPQIAVAKPPRLRGGYLHGGTAWLPGENSDSHQVSGHFVGIRYRIIAKALAQQFLILPQSTEIQTMKANLPPIRQQD